MHFIIVPLFESLSAFGLDYFSTRGHIVLLFAPDKTKTREGGEKRPVFDFDQMRLRLTLCHTFKRSSFLDYYSVWFIFEILYSFVIASSLTSYTRCVIIYPLNVALRICATVYRANNRRFEIVPSISHHPTQIRGAPILSWSYGFGLCHSIFTVWLQSLDSSPFILKLVVVNFKNEEHYYVFRILKPFLLVSLNRQR